MFVLSLFEDGDADISSWLWKAAFLENIVCVCVCFGWDGGMVKDYEL